MTEQFKDVLFYEGEAYFLTAKKGSLTLPHPRDFGIKPFMIGTTCYRGYYCTYRVEDNKLLLRHLVANSLEENFPIIGEVKPIYRKPYVLGDDEPEPPPLEGRFVVHDPDVSDKREVWYDGAIYAGLKMLVPITGSVLIGKNYNWTVHVHSGFNTPAAYEPAIELQFEKGNLVSVIDHSEQNAKIYEILRQTDIKELPQEQATYVTGLLSWTADWVEIDY